MALTERFDQPDFADAVETDLDYIKTNFWFLLVAAVNGSIVIPGWSTSVGFTSSPQDFTQPDTIVLSKLDTAVSPNVTREIHIYYTWTSGNVTGMVIKYDDGSTSPSLLTVTGGTITLTYDGNGNFTGATSA